MTVEKILKTAASFLGVKENPAGSNCVVFNTDYYGSPVSGASYPWCCAFVWDVFRLAGASKLFYDGLKTAYCPSVLSWGKRNNLVVNKAGAVAGDLILFDFNGDGSPEHIGILESRSGSQYIVIEGNTSVTSNDNGGAVMRRSRYAAQILAVVRPKYDGAAVTTTPAHNVYTKDQFIRELQTALNVVVDGIPGKQTLNATPTLSSRLNRKHAAVRPVQKWLYAQGYTVVGEADGIAGEKFDTAVRKYQGAHGCVIDGEITARAKTWRVLLGLEGTA